MSPSGFYSSVFDTAKSLGATDTQAHLAASQASNETGFGQHVVGNNYFGIKAGDAFPGDSVNAATNEVVNGQTVGENANFRAYDGLADSVAGYMNFMSNAFPDSWNAPNFEEAAKNLVNGQFGQYATDPNYVSKVANIADRYGKYAYAADPANVPVPYSPDDPAANSLQAQQVDGLAGVINPAIPTPVMRQDLPASLPTQNSFADLAAAPPMGVLSNVPASGELSTTPGLSASTDVAMAAPTGDVTRGMLAPVGNPVNSGFTDMAAAGPMGVLSNVPATAENFAGLNVPANATVNSFPSAAGFDNARFGDPAPADQGFDVGRFGDPAPSAFDTARFGPTALESVMQTPTAINPSLPTMNSFAEVASADPISAPMNVQTPSLNNFGDLAASQPVGTANTTGVNSPQMAAMRESVRQQLDSMPSYTAPADLAVSPTVSTPTNSFSDMAIAGPMNTGMLSSFQNPATTTAAENAIGGILSTPSVPAGYQQMADTGVIGGITNLSGNTLVGPTGVATNNFPTVQQPVINAVTTDTAQSVDTPTIAGPTNMPAVQQQQAAVQGSFPAAPAKQGILSGALNKGTITGGVLGALAGGPIGGILGGILGNQINKGMLSPDGQVMGGMNLGPGLANIQSIYSGNAPVGSTAQANNGATVTAAPGGWTTVTNPYGVTESVSPQGHYAANFSGFFSGNNHAGNSPAGGTPGGNSGAAI